MKLTTVCLAVLGTLGLAACDQSPSSANPAKAPTPAAAEPASEVPAPAGSEATKASPAGNPRVVVDNDTGVTITPAGGGQPIRVAFGTPSAQARETLVAALGQSSDAMNPDCPWGPATLWDWPAGQAIVVNNELVGWTGDDGDFGYTCIAD